MTAMQGGGLFQDLGGWDPLPLREQLYRGGFHREALEAAGLPERWLRSAARRSALLGRVPEGAPLESLLRLFTLGDWIDADRALVSLGRALEGLLHIGFLEAGGGRVRSRFQLCPLADGWIACDFHQRQGEDVDDYVMGIGPSTTLLASLTPRVRGRVLEMACGIGWLAGELAATGAPVVATDRNARALDLGRFSARLRGTGEVEFRHGDTFEPVAGETFDLIVSNPPYVQSPGGNMSYREAPAEDPICARLLRGVPAHLAPGGIAVVLLNWMHRDDEDWEGEPLSWVPAEGVRRWLFQSDCSTPADYSWTWIANDLRFGDEQAAEAEIRRWLEYYRSRGVGRISGGFMVIQKCDAGQEWTRTESRAAESVGMAAGSELLRVLANETWLSTGPELLSARFSVPDGIGAEAGLRLGPDGWSRETIRLTSPEQLSYDGQIDENILRLLALLDGGGTADEMVREIRAKPGFEGIDDLPARIEGLVRELVSRGMLVPA